MVKRYIWIFLAVLAALFVVSLLGTRYAIVTLGLSATMVAVPLLWRRPRALSWIFAAVGAVAWAIEELAWVAARLTGTFGATTITDLGYYVGAAAWFAALLLAPGKRLPRTLLLAAAPPMALLVWLLVSSAENVVSLIFPLTELALLVAALPFLGGALKRGASEGRLLVVLGFYFRTLGGAAYAWLAGGTEGGFLVIWLLSYVVLALGIYMELADVHHEMLSAGAAIVCLQLLSGVLLIQIQVRQDLRGSLDTAFVIGSLAYLQFIVVMVILLNNYRRQVEAQEELRSWSTLLDRVMSESGDGITLRGLMERTVQRLPALHGFEVHSEASHGNLSGYAYPLVTGGTEVGRLFFRRQPERTAVLDTTAPLLAARVQHLVEHQRWRHAALTDPLTGLLNRRGLELRAPELLQEARAEGRPVSVALIDIDHFKRVNDVYGHAVGDQALKTLASLLQRHIRPQDLAVRWGGEEFLVVLSSDLTGAHDAMARLRRGLQGASPRQVAWPLAASVGIAGGEVPQDDDVERWIDEADAALLDAKKNGRDRIEIADD